MFFYLCSYSGNVFSGEFYYDLNLLNGLNFNPVNLDSKRMNANLNVDGVYRIKIYVNDKSIGYEHIAFKNIDNVFTPQISNALISKIGFNRKVVDYIEKENITNYSQLISQFPEISFNSIISKNLLILRIPKAYLRQPDETFPDEWDYGMNTFFTSYNYSGYNSRIRYNDESKNQYLYLYSGVNISKWQLRNNSFYNRNNTDSKFYSDQTWLSRDFGEINSRLTIGQTQSSGLLSNSFRFDGLNLQSISDMRPSFMNGYFPEVYGNALTNATVKVYQGNNLLYQTFVSPGAFVLSDIPISGNTELRVQVIEEGGSVHEEFVPVTSASTLRRKSILDYSLSIGNLKSQRIKLNKNEVVSADLLYGLTSFSTLLTGMTISDNYQNVIIGGGFNLGYIGATSVIGSNSVNKLYNVDGNSLELRHSKRLSDFSTQIDFSHIFFVGDYSNIDDDLSLITHRNKKSTSSLSLNQPTNSFGNFRMSFFLNSFDDDALNSTTYSFSWNKFIYGAFIMLSSSRSDYSNVRYKNENIYSINVSVPFGSDSKAYTPSNIRYGYSTGNNFTTNTFALDKSYLNNKAQINFSHGTTRSTNSRTVTNGISGTYVSDFSRLSAGLIKRSDRYMQKNWRLSGALVAHPYGLTLSPYPINSDSASTLVSIPGASGVSISNNLSSTDFLGNVFVNNLRSYKKNKITIQSRKLPNDIELGNIENTLIPASGAIVRTLFSANVGYKAILNINFKGKPLPFGSTVKEDPSAFAGSNGILYITGLKENQQLNINTPDGDSCKVVFSKEKSKYSNGLYFSDITCL